MIPTILTSIRPVASICMGKIVSVFCGALCSKKGKDGKVRLTGAHVPSNMLWTSKRGLANGTFVVSAHSSVEKKKE